MSPLRLHRLGHQKQLIFVAAEDLTQIDQLEEPRWTANSAPIDGLSCDAAFLRHLDGLGNGRIHPAELKAAGAWLLRCLRDRTQVGSPESPLHLAAIDDSHDEGHALRKTAERVLANLGLDPCEASQVLTLEQLRDRRHLLAGGATNGDGVIPPEAVSEPGLQALVHDLAHTMGAITDANGKRGATAEQLERFLREGPAWLAWHEEAAAQGPQGEALRCWGDQTGEAWKACEALAPQLEAFFGICALQPDLPGLDEGSLAAGKWPASAPLAPPNPAGEIDAETWINPSCRRAWDRFRTQVLAREGLDGTLRATDWMRIRRRLRPYGDWRAAEPQTPAADLGADKIRRYLADRSLAAGLDAMIRTDRAVADDLARVARLERLLLYQRHLLEFANNFVNYSAFYDPGRRSLPEVGSLLMDGRMFHLALRVKDRAQHKKRAAASGFFLLYVQVQQATGSYEVAVAVTGTRRGDLQLGKRGVFYELDGRDLPAVVVDLLENPISIGEALQKPFRRLASMIERLTERLGENRYQALEQVAEKRAEAADQALQELPQTELGISSPQRPEVGPGRMREALLSGGLALAALSSAAAYIAKTLTSIAVADLAVMLLFLALCFTVPTAILTANRLRRRDLAPVLEASGWGINHPLRVPAWASPVFTRRPPLPADAQLQRGDLLRDYRAAAGAKSPSRRLVILVLALLLALASTAWALSQGVI